VQGPSPRADQETSAGGVVVRCTEDGPRYLLILDGHGNWGFPKGHVDPGESAEEAARREIGEETGLADLTLHEPLGTIDWYFRHQGRLVHKYCHYFLYTSASDDASPQGVEGIQACTWHEFEQGTEKLRFKNAREILRRAATLATRVCASA